MAKTRRFHPTILIAQNFAPDHLFLSNQILIHLQHALHSMCVIKLIN